MSETTATKAKATKATSATSVEGENKRGKGKPRPSAIVGDIDFGGVDPAKLEAEAVRRTPWDDVLDKVYDATLAGEVGRDENGALRFVKIGTYATSQSAKAQVKAFTEKKLTNTYEFKVSGKELFVRVIETA
jgi:hypothetical protein